MQNSPLVLPPHHAVHDARVALDDLHDLRGDVLVCIVRHGGGGVAALGVERHGGAHGVQEPALVDAGQREAAPVERLGALRGGPDAHGRERAADRGEEARLLGEGPGVRDHAEGARLEAVVVVEAHGLVRAHERVQREAGGLQAPAAARVAAVEDGPAVLLRERVDGAEERAEVGLGVDVLLAVGGEQEVAAGLQALALEHVGRVDLPQVRT